MRHASAETKDLAAPGNGVLAGVPAVVAAHHLFSRAPPALQSPMSRSGLTPAQVRVPDIVEFLPRQWCLHFSMVS